VRSQVEGDDVGYIRMTQFTEQTTDGLKKAIADISAPSAVPPALRAGLNGSFLGIDDLFGGERPLPRAYIAEAERIVATKAAEYGGWLEARR